MTYVREIVVQKQNKYLHRHSLFRHSCSPWESNPTQPDRGLALGAGLESESTTGVSWGYYEIPNGEPNITCTFR